MRKGIEVIKIKINKKTTYRVKTSPGSFTKESHHTFKEELTPIIQKLLQKID